MMTSSNARFALVLAASAAVMLSACASGNRELDAGQRMSARGDSISGRGEAWSDGQRDVLKGQKAQQKQADRAARAERDLRKARDKTAKAERELQAAQKAQVDAQQQINAGTTQMQRAETEYGDIRNRPSAIPPQ